MNSATSFLCTILTLAFFACGVFFCVHAGTELAKRSGGSASLETVKLEQITESEKITGTVRSALGHFAETESPVPFYDDLTLYVFPAASVEGSDVFMCVAVPEEKRADMEALSEQTWEWYGGGEAPSSSVDISGYTRKLSDDEQKYLNGFFTANFPEAASKGASISVVPYVIECQNENAPSTEMACGIVLLVIGAFGAIFLIIKRKNSASLQN